MFGGALGSVTRYALGTAINVRIGGRFPLGTMVINITGSFLIGFLMILLTIVDLETKIRQPFWKR